MKQFILFPALALALVVLVVGCASSPTATPLPAPTAVPATIIPSPTTAPTATALPPTPTSAPTNTPAPPTNTPIPTTPAPTATNTRAPVTRAPETATSAATAEPATPTAVALKFAAPELVEPHSGQTRRAGSENLVFSWKPVGALGSNECYLVNIQLKNTIDNHIAEQSFIAGDSCGNQGDTQLVKFTVNKKAPAPDYAGLLAIANSPTPANNFDVTWTVTVVENNGADVNNPNPAQYVPLSPTSAPLTFGLQG